MPEVSWVAVDKEGIRCAAQPGQAHSKPHEHHVPANNTTDFIGGMEAGVAKHGGLRVRGSNCSGSKSKGGRSVIGGLLEAQQLLRTGGGSEGIARAANRGEIGETR